jgi:hypothetical protein
MADIEARFGEQLTHDMDGVIFIVDNQNERVGHRPSDSLGRKRGTRLGKPLP